MPFALTIFLSAFLLFVVQLILGKFILPWFGGAPAVWTTCMLFFQVVLLLGYTYAHLISTRLRLARQVQLHLGLLAVSVLVLGFLFWQWGSPILPSDFWKPKSPERPIAQILTLLSVSIGFPFFLLSSTSPLLQQWATLKDASRNPFRLFALSNAGSMLALLAYPSVVEPWTRLSVQSRMWAALYVIFAAACGVCAMNVLRIPNLRGQQPPAATINTLAPNWATIALWLALPAITSAMFLSVTNHLCQDVAVVPFLWVLPLAIYLVSFILCFQSDRWYQRGPFLAAAAVATIVLLKVGLQGSPLGLTTQILLHSAFLFCFCVTGHGELVRLKPESRQLTLFYLAVALGGVIGGTFVALAAPIIFRGYWELHLSLLAGWGILALILARDRASMFHLGDRWQFACLVLLVSYPLLDFALELTPLRNVDFFWKNLLAFTLATAVVLTTLVMALCWRLPLARSKLWPRLVIIGVACFTAYTAQERMRRAGSEVVDARRNFYGVVRVLRNRMEANGQPSTFLQLTHGQINHGIQFQDESLRRQPVGYYSRGSGIDLAFRFHQRRAKSLPLNIGVLGLGVGTLAAFANDGDLVRFYEINPAVCDYSAGAHPFFTYVRDCGGHAEVVTGDARLSLEREAGGDTRAQFDILAMDAFSGDAVPVHLLTREAFEIYLARLRDEDGIIAVNISNRYLDLRDLMFGIAGHFRLEAVIIDSQGNPPDRTASRWCLLARSKTFVQQEPIHSASSRYQARRDVHWTDDFSNLFQLLR